MFNFILSKCATIRCGVSLTLLASLGVGATEDLASRGPDGAGIKSVAIYSYDGGSRNTIYANGKMQAPVDIVYELATGYAIKGVELKTLNTETPLNDWVVSDKNNGYLPGISGAKGVVQKTTSLRRYISTNSPRTAAVCVVLTASKPDSADSVFSTCNNGVQSASVYITAIAPEYLTKNDVELTGWRDSTEINEYVAAGSGTCSSQIKEQVLKTINSHPKIKSFEVDHKLTSAESGLLRVRDSLLSQYYIKNDPEDVGHIMSWVAHPDTVKKIRFIENVGLDQHWGWTLEREIPYHSSNEPYYILSLITYKLRDDKFLYQSNSYSHYLCAEPWSIDETSICQYYTGSLNETAVKSFFYNKNIETWKVERPKGAINLIDEYGTTSQLIFGIREAQNKNKDYEVYIE